jgi:hypothetical protein
MGTQRATELPMSTESEKIAKLRSQYGCMNATWCSTTSSIWEPRARVRVLWRNGLIHNCGRNH